MNTQVTIRHHLPSLAHPPSFFWGEIYSFPAEPFIKKQDFFSSLFLHSGCWKPEAKTCVHQIRLTNHSSITAISLWKPIWSPPEKTFNCLWWRKVTTTEKGKESYCFPFWFHTPRPTVAAAVYLYRLSFQLHKLAVNLQLSVYQPSVPSPLHFSAFLHASV